MELTHRGHSCLVIDVAGQKILLDPGTFSDLDGLEGLSAIVVTHQHPDHWDPERAPKLVENNPDAVVYAEPQAAQVMAAHGVQATPVRGGETFSIGPVTVRAIGEQHAVIHPYVERVGNTGFVFSADGEPTMCHPGDALDADPGDVDILAVPINAPWAAVKEAIAFVRRVQPGQVVPIHDGLLNETGRGMYLGHVENFGLDGGCTVLDLAGRGAVTV